MIFFDFETYFADDFTLKKMGIDEYVKSDRFKVHGLSYAYDNEEPHYVWGDELDNFIENADWNDVVCHNAYFDIFVLTQYYGISPGFIYDTMCMSRALYGPDVSASLENVAQRMKIGGKVPGLDISKNKTVLTKREQKILGDYAIHDVILLRDIFNELNRDFPPSELKLIDITIRMFTEPKVEINGKILKKRLAEILKEKDGIISKLKDIVRGEFAFNPLNDWKREIIDILQSDERFASELARFISVPTKISPRTGEEIPALAKTDVAFIKLKEHKNKAVQALVNARLAISSNLEENRIERFLNYTEGMYIYLTYYGAHTGRWSGGNRINVQNLTRGSVLRESIQAPEGYMIAMADQSQIEARLTAWLAWIVTGKKGNAGVKKLLDTFRGGGDVYAMFASELYGYEVSKQTHPKERFIGKTAILGLGYGMGAKKFQKQLKQVGVDYSLQEAKNVVEFYRDTYSEIPRLWYGLEKTLDYIMKDAEAKITDFLKVDRQGIRLPNALYIRYNRLKKEDGGYTYEGYKGGRRRRINVYGGLITENVIQALARITIGNNILTMHSTLPSIPFSKTPIIAMVHDEVLVLAREEEVQDVFDKMIDIMLVPPDWAKGLPLDAEGGWAREYSK